MSATQWRTLALFAGALFALSFFSPPAAMALLGVTGFILIARKYGMSSPAGGGGGNIL